MTAVPPFFAGFYQMGFVTADLEAAQTRLAERFGVTRFRVKNDPDRLSAAHAYAGDVMLEILQPGPLAPALFQDLVPSQGAVRLHHHGFAVRSPADWDMIVTVVTAQGWATPHKGEVMNGDLRFLYVDTRADLGCYSEYVLRTGAALSLYDDVPRN